MWFYLSYKVLHSSLFSCNFAAENQGHRVIPALIDALSLHKVRAEVVREVAGAIRTICVNNGIDQRYR